MHICSKQMAGLCLNYFKIITLAKPPVMMHLLAGQEVSRRSACSRTALKSNVYFANTLICRALRFILSTHSIPWKSTKINSNRETRNAKQGGGGCVLHMDQGSLQSTQRGKNEGPTDYCIMVVIIGNQRAWSNLMHLEKEQQLTQISTFNLFECFCHCQILYFICIRVHKHLQKLKKLEN